MKIIYAFLFLLGQQFQSIAQVYTYPENSFRGNLYNAFAIIVDNTVIKGFEIIHNTNNEFNIDFAKEIIRPDSSCFLINACITDSFCNPIGLWIEKGLEKQPINENDGYGNFYLKPNGAVLFLPDNIKVVETSEIIKYKDILMGVQSGPMLVVNGVINNKFGLQSMNKHIRCAVGTSQENGNTKLVFAISKSKVSFYELALYMSKKMKADNALCLESQGCSMYFEGIKFENDTYNGKICNYFYFNY